MRCFLNKDILSYIGGIPTLNSLAGPDGIIPSWNYNGIFSIKPAYGMLIKKLSQFTRRKMEASLVFKCATMCSSVSLVGVQGTTLY